MRMTKKDKFIAMIPDFEEMARQGYSEREMIRQKRISTATFYRYKRELPEFKEALERGYEYSLPRVIPALYKAAIGYRYKEQTQERDKNGELVTTKVVEKEVPPNVAAIMNILKNKMPEKWLVAEKMDINIRNERNDLEKLTTEEIDKLIDLIQQEEEE